jgi:hypothetical protein
MPFPSSNAILLTGAVSSLGTVPVVYVGVLGEDKYIDEVQKTNFVCRMVGQSSQVSRFLTVSSLPSSLRRLPHR